MAIVFFKNSHQPNMKGGPDFGLDLRFPDSDGVAFEKDGVYFAGGVRIARGISNFTTDTSISLEEWIEKSFGAKKSEQRSVDYVAGTFYPRIWRNQVGPARLLETASKQSLRRSSVALRILLQKLEELFLTIEPSAENLSSYGHKMREVLLLACMYVESSCKSVLKENGYKANGDPSTKDYVLLLEPMALDAYKLSLQSYPNILEFSPFKGWDAAQGSKSLVWYNAYNTTKHDLEGSLHLATLENAIVSVGAAVVMFQSQFGNQMPKHWIWQSSIFNDVTNTFQVIFDQDKYPDNLYIANVVLVPDGRANQPGVPPEGTSATDWTSVHYPFRTPQP